MLEKNLYQSEIQPDVGSALSVEEREELSSSFEWTDTVETGMQKRRFDVHKLILLAHDLFVINLAFGIGAFLDEFGLYLHGNWTLSAVFFLFSLFLISFFHSYDLYNYHTLFLEKDHWVNFAKSFFWGMLTVCITAFVSNQYHVIKEGNSVFGITFFVGIGVLLLSRFIWSHLINFLKAWGLSFVGIVLIGMVGAGDGFAIFENWSLVTMSFIVAFCLVFACRHVLIQVLFGKRMARHFRRQMIVVGSNGEAKEITDYVIDRNAPCWVNGFVGRDGCDNLKMSINKDHLGGLKDLPRAVEQNKIDEIIVTEEGMDKRALISLLDYCVSKGLTVWFSPKLLPIIDIKLHISNFCGLRMIKLCGQNHKWILNKIKHASDALIALPLFLISLPLFAVITLAVKLSSPGPIFYRARAIGKSGKEFEMYKFRSMRVDDSIEIHKDYVTKLIKGEIGEGDSSEDGVFKVTYDPRVTSVGRFLRKSSLDELPQLINVLKGEMSLVGPRPCLPYEFELYEDWHKKRANVRPGITGLWQVAGRSTVTFEDMVLLDLYYVYNRNILMDMSILFETIFAVLGKRGAY